MEKDLYDDQQFTDFDEMDLIETRMREVRFMETDLAAHLRTLGLPDAHVVVESLDEDPCIAIHELFLSADEASELIRRLDPRWEGSSYERDWEGLPNHFEEEEEFPPEVTQGDQEELFDLSDPPEPDEPAKQPLLPSPELVLPEEEDLNHTQHQEAEQQQKKQKMSTFTEENDLSESSVKRRIVANIIDTLRKRKNSIVTR